MTSELPDFSESQWAFLAFLQACKEPVSIDLVGAVTPLLPGEFLDLKSMCEENGWIQKSETKACCLAPELPLPLKVTLDKINTPERFADYVNRLVALNLLDRVSREVMANLLSGCRRDKEAAWLETDLARDAIKASDFNTAKRYLTRSLARLASHSDDAEIDELFISNALLLSKHYFYLDSELDGLPSLLQAAEDRAERLGDQRSCALIKLHRGAFFNFARRRSDALSALSAGLEAVARINDVDLQKQSAEYFGIYYYIQGLYKEALDFLERARESSEPQQKDGIISPTAIIYLGYCAAYVGQIQRSIGTFDYYWRLAMERSNRPFACIMRSGLGAVLLTIKKDDEGSLHLNSALKEAEETRTALGLYLSQGALSYLYFLKGQEEKAYNLMAKTVKQANESGIMGHYSSPFILEMLFYFDLLGYDPLPGFNFKSEVEKIHNEPNIHLRGVALRLQYKQGLTRGLAETQLQSYLEKSEDYLKRSGDPVELAKTRLEVARLNLVHGDLAKARFLAQQARQGLSGYFEGLFPDDLRHLLENKPSFTGNKAERDYFIQRFLDLMDDLVPDSNLEYILSRIVTATNRFFGAERGGLFWFNDQKLQNVEFRVGCNLTQSDISHKNFQSNLALIKKTFRMNQPVVVRLQKAQGEPSKPRAILCIPMGVEGRVQGVLYHDNSYVSDCFDDIDPDQLMQLAVRLSNQLEHILAFRRQSEGKSRLLLQNSVPFEQAENAGFLTQNLVMTEILDRADRMAASEAPVVILGETGVGKELLAHRLHDRSPRSKHPFVIVDATTIPENLLESELFGYEKGAFTGANQRKPGRLELAHRGTLFIDEIGELPLSSQTKLLRALQERTFTRLGGCKTQAANFRLIVATNRDLAKEVSAGKFRHDLFYRINVMSITIPPLRKRPEDVIMLAEHFIKLFADRHKRPRIGLTSQDRERLIAYQWPGNVRELKNMIERSVILSDEKLLDLGLDHGSGNALNHPFSDTPSMDELQRRYISYLLEKTQGRVSEVAELLNMKRTSLYFRMEKLGLKR